MTPEQIAALVADLRATARAVRSKDGYLAAQQARDHEVIADAIEHLVAERDAMQAEVARLSTPPDDAEVAALIDVLRSLGDRAVFAPHQHHVAADALTRLSHALAAETAKREAMEEALRQYAYAFCEGFCDDMPTMEYTDADCERDCGGCKARATLAKHGSK